MCKYLEIWWFWLELMSIQFYTIIKDMLSYLFIYSNEGK